jgi:hypothetical protein
MGNPTEVRGWGTESYSTRYCFLRFALFSGVTPTDYQAMADFDLRTLSRKILLLVAILSILVIGEMVLVSAEEPAASVPTSQQAG